MWSGSRRSSWRRQFHLSAAQIRKDLAQFGEFGIRGVGYEVPKLIDRLTRLLGLDRPHPVAIVGMGNLGLGPGRFGELHSGSFHVVAGLDNDPAKIGRRVGDIRVASADDMERVVRETDAEIGVLTVPADAAQENCDRLVAAGIRSILNFAPVRLRTVEGVRTKDVDLRIDLEELGFFLTS